MLRWPRTRPAAPPGPAPVSCVPLLVDRDHSRVLALPPQDDGLPTQRLDVLVARGRVLLHHHELPTSVELDYEPRRRPCVQALLDLPARMAVAVRGLRAERDPLRPDRHDRRGALA